ncbi:hypothetical protein EDC04DRAFT_3140281 [Pisolithus marmoratus]|nr:hypothetical protein EDC04DRAFT_3140281 [Pisolithus marmoratus]
MILGQPLTLSDNAGVPQVSAPIKGTQPGNADAHIIVSVETSGKTEGINIDNFARDDNGRDRECSISPSTLSRVFRGVAVATKTPDHVASPILQWILSFGRKVALDPDCQDHDDTLAFQPDEWCGATVGLAHVDSQQLARVAIGIAVLRERARRSQCATAADLAMVWGLVHSAITHSMTTGPCFSVARSSQGFLAIPLCSLLRDGNIDELYRCHVWLPDGQRGNPDFAVHSHQAYAQSWILAGEGRDFQYAFEPVVSMADATHAVYALSWTDNKNTSSTYKTHQTSSTVVNTGKLGRTTLTTGPALHTRDMSYYVPSGVFHSSEVAPDTLHATLFVFDSHRGFTKDAPVLGPKDSESSTQLRDPAGVTPAALANLVDVMRSWEILMEQGQQHSARAEWEDALQAFNRALYLCESVPDFPNAVRHKRQVLGQLGNTNRRFGRSEQARDILEKALVEMEPDSPECIEFSGELGVVYRHMNRLEDAKRMFEDQHNTAKRLSNEQAQCRAVGNLGMVNYQLAGRNGGLPLDLAIEQLTERVTSVRRLKAALDTRSSDPSQRHSFNIFTTWEIVGLSRLSLCYTTCGDAKQAIGTASEGVELAKNSMDPTVIATSRFFHGRALLLDGQRQEVLKQFNPPNACTPAIALCKEPSEEHLSYLAELVDTGADMDAVDEQGYKALDYAVFNGDTAMEMLVLAGFRMQLDGDVEVKVAQRQREAKLRKGYRELFQNKLRPVLLGSSCNKDALQDLRRVYADALATDTEKAGLFDVLTFVRFRDFLSFGKIPGSGDTLPGSNDPLLQRFRLNTQNNSQLSNTPEFVIFFSYRWINKGSATARDTPDDSNNKRYKRMVNATENFLRFHPSVGREKLGIWINHPCVDQDDPAPDVSALPMIIAPCNALISLVDDAYHTRAWCSVEVMMLQTLGKSYNLHMWYEYVPSESGEGTLREGPMDLQFVMRDKELTYESDRAKVLLLDRQSKLRG